MPIIKVGKRKIQVDDPKLEETPIKEPIKKKGVLEKKENEDKERD
jgi:hypothetical protein